MNKRPQRTRQKEMRREAILDAAWSEFVQTGYAATRMEDIAARIGVTKGTVFFHFESKEKLFEAVIEQLVEVQLATIDAGPVDDMREPVAALKALVRSAYRLIVSDSRHQDVLRLIIAEGKRFPQLSGIYRSGFVEPMRGRFLQIYEQGRSAGVFRAFNEEHLSDVLIGPALLKMITALILEGCNTPPDDYVDIHCDVVLNGILAPS